MNAEDVLSYGHRTVQGTLDELSSSDVTQSGVCGVWSVKDLVAYLAVSFENVLVDVLRNATGWSGSTDRLDAYLADRDGFNDSEVARRAGDTYGQVLAEYDGAYDEVSKLIRLTQNDLRRQKGRLEWYGAEYDLEDFITYQYYGHKREHCAQMAAFRDRL